jgi:hypothetical protein
MRHRTIALPLALLASLALASVAVAGGWAQVTAKTVPVDPPAGEATTIELGVSQHGITPVSWPDLTVIATNDTTGATFRTKAEAKGPTGSYVATLTFPSAGAWTLTFDSTDLIMEGLTKLQVGLSGVAAPAAPAGAGAGAQNPTTAPAAPATDVMLVVLLLFVLAVGLGVAALGLRSRNATGDSRLSVRT